MYDFVHVARAFGVVAGIVGLAVIAASHADAHERKQASQQALPAGEFGGPFMLIDQTGTEVTERTFLGRVMVIYFGYTHCPDICPIDAANIAQAVDLLGSAGQEVQPLFITIDPRRDTPERLSEWLGAIHPRFIGLTGTEQAVASTAKAFKVIYERVETAKGYDYAVNHPGLTYVMNRNGEFLFLLPPGTPPEVIAEELRTVLNGEG